MKKLWVSKLVSFVKAKFFSMCMASMCSFAKMTPSIVMVFVFVVALSFFDGPHGGTGTGEGTTYKLLSKQSLRTPK